jgi:hypothetical protein
LIRSVRLPGDRAAVLSFIDASQAYESAFEPNRRLYARVADEHLASLLAQIEKHQGLNLIAEIDGHPIGWAVARALSAYRSAGYAPYAIELRKAL